MRNTIRRGVLVTATAACALGFGLFSASAASVPALPTVPQLPQLPLSSLTNLGQGLGQGLDTVAPTTSNLDTAPTMPDVASMPTTPDFAMVPEEESRIGAGDLTSTLGSVTGLSSLLTLADTAKQLGMPALGNVAGLAEVTQLTELPRVTDLAQELPFDLPAEIDSSQMPDVPQVPATANELTKTPVAELPNPERMPVVAQVDHNNLPQKLIPNTDGVTVQGLPKPDMPDMATAQDVVKVPTSMPQTPDMKSVGVPQQLPGASDLAMPNAPTVHDVTGDVVLPAQLPAV